MKFPIVEIAETESILFYVRRWGKIGTYIFDVGEQENGNKWAYINGAVLHSIHLNKFDAIKMWKAIIS